MVAEMIVTAYDRPLRSRLEALAREEGSQHRPSSGV